MIQLPRWLRVPDQELESLSRCRECGSIVRDNVVSLRKHLGHQLVSLTGLHINEVLRIRLGRL